MATFNNSPQFGSFLFAAPCHSSLSFQDVQNLLLEQDFAEKNKIDVTAALVNRLTDLKRLDSGAFENFAKSIYSTMPLRRSLESSSGVLCSEGQAILDHLTKYMGTNDHHIADSVLTSLKTIRHTHSIVSPVTSMNFRVNRIVATPSAVASTAPQNQQLVKADKQLTDRFVQDLFHQNFRFANGKPDVQALTAALEKIKAANETIYSGIAIRLCVPWDGVNEGKKLIPTLGIFPRNILPVLKDQKIKTSKMDNEEYREDVANRILTGLAQWRARGPLPGGTFSSKADEEIAARKTIQALLNPATRPKLYHDLLKELSVKSGEKRLEFFKDVYDRLENPPSCGKFPYSVALMAYLKSGDKAQEDVHLALWKLRSDRYFALQTGQRLHW